MVLKSQKNPMQKALPTESLRGPCDKSLICISQSDVCLMSCFERLTEVLIKHINSNTLQILIYPILEATRPDARVDRGARGLAQKFLSCIYSYQLFNPSSNLSAPIPPYPFPPAMSARNQSNHKKREA